jgi:hypothetical protein
MIKIVISYSHQNRAWCEDVARQLSGLNDVSVYFDYRNDASTHWDEAFRHNIETADIALLLISPDYVNSAVCRAETLLAQRLQDARQLRVIPVMLRKCVFDVLRLDGANPSPVGEKPLEEWAKRDDAAMAVARDVKNVLAVHGQARTRPRTFSIDIARIETNLHFRCARDKQKRELFEALDNTRRQRRPFVVVLAGHENESIDWYLRRLQRALLQEYFRPCDPRQLTPLPWSTSQPGRSPFATFAADLRSSFGCLPKTSMEEINASLKSKSKVAVLQSRVSADTWSSSTEATFDAYLRLWNEWPDLPEGHQLIVAIAVAYRSTKPAGLGGLLRHIKARISKHAPEEFPWLPYAAARYLQDLRHSNLAKLTGVEGVVLEELPNVQRAEFMHWLTQSEDQNDLLDPARVRNRIPAFNYEFPRCMHEVSTVGLKEFLRGF